MPFGEVVPSKTSGLPELLTQNPSGFSNSGPAGHRTLRPVVPRTNTLIHLPPQPIPQEATRLKIAYVYDAVYPWVKGGVEKRIREVSVRLL
ncbi:MULTISPECIES: hypothetical protein [Methanoculleus]|uniref:Uncharacterized protein n=2 Tax=Methanoculleus TaxID=45989 RepID=A3CRW5_METMJ|nr:MULTISPECIES: hypothetical protein [Methanoculleus]ABN56115.1 hypothetical protein Memar_0181 [Methanoculleus marisnigri JR1]UYU17590.1 hypothetical protein OH143_07685 [Methanoculleus submarinus]